MRIVVELSLSLVGGYLALGMAFAGWFHVVGLQRLDPSAAASGWGFRSVITPGIVALWPVLWLKGRRLAQGRLWWGVPGAPWSQKQLRRGHDLLWQALAIAVPVGLAAIWWRPPVVEASRLPPPLLRNH